MPAPQSEPPVSTAHDVSTTPESPETTTLIAVPVDPYVIHCQWEVRPADIENAKRSLGVNEREYWPVLQFYKISNAARDEAARAPSFSANVQLAAENWYVRGCSPEHAYRADLVLMREDGSFAVVARSSPVETPPSAPSNDADEHWLPIRLEPQQPETATPMRPPPDLALDRLSSASGEFVAPRMSLPIDMGEEVRAKPAALDHEPEPAPALLPASPSRLPIDNLLTQLYLGIAKEQPALARGLFFRTEPGMEVAFRQTTRFEANLGVIVDLTELNERSFASGISSRTK